MQRPGPFALIVTALACVAILAYATVAHTAGTWRTDYASQFSAVDEPALACYWSGKNPGVAHKTLPCGTKLTICKVRCIVVKVIDRGPYVLGRVFDLDTKVAKYIGFHSLGYVRWRLGGKVQHRANGKRLASAARAAREE